MIPRRTLRTSVAPLAALLIQLALPAAAQLVADKPWSYEGPKGDPAMLSRHNAIVAEVKKMPDAQLCFIGDSITEFWGTTGREVWNKQYGGRKALNLGVSGDRTTGCLWRLDNGELEGIEPKLTVILIGTNNTWGDEVPVDANVRGIKLVTELVLRKLPKTRVLLLALLPREDFNTNGKWKKVNQELAKEKFDSRVDYLDIGAKFLDGEGKITRGFSGDKLHLAADGYQIWADAIESRVAAALAAK